MCGFGVADYFVVDCAQYDEVEVLEQAVLATQHVHLVQYHVRVHHVHSRQRVGVRGSGGGGGGRGGGCGSGSDDGEVRAAGWWFALRVTGGACRYATVQIVADIPLLDDVPQWAAARLLHIRSLPDHRVRGDRQAALGGRERREGGTDEMSSVAMGPTLEVDGSG